MGFCGNWRILLYSSRTAQRLAATARPFIGRHRRASKGLATDRRRLGAVNINSRGDGPALHGEPGDRHTSDRRWFHAQSHDPTLVTMPHTKAHSWYALHDLNLMAMPRSHAVRSSRKPCAPRPTSTLSCMPEIPPDGGPAESQAQDKVVEGRRCLPFAGSSQVGCKCGQ